MSPPCRVVIFQKLSYPRVRVRVVSMSVQLRWWVLAMVNRLRRKRRQGEKKEEEMEWKVFLKQEKRKEDAIHLPQARNLHQIDV